MLIPTQGAMRLEKTTTQSNLGVREGFLEEMVLELLGKTYGSLRGGKGFRQREQQGWPCE